MSVKRSVPPLTLPPNSASVSALLPSAFENASNDNDALSANSLVVNKPSLNCIPTSDNCLKLSTCVSINLASCSTLFISMVKYTFPVRSAIVVKVDANPSTDIEPLINWLDNIFVPVHKEYIPFWFLRNSNSHSDNWSVTSSICSISSFTIFSFLVSAGDFDGPAPNPLTPICFARARRVASEAGPRSAPLPSS